ncbi:MAG TPA: MoaD/ThiS family protein [Syntrophorhabdaceae bacterium]|nr:MoaD/ThiS family protein [Syntrophorhabdaceae bacterium]HPP06270.1 MoaD/ThiS family protein [Syntrophorhabdaceae bacterium]
MTVEFDGKKINVEKITTVLKLLEKLSINREAHLVFVNSKLVTEDYKLKDDDEIKIIRVVSGG